MRLSYLGSSFLLLGSASLLTGGDPWLNLLGVVFLVSGIGGILYAIGVLLGRAALRGVGFVIFGVSGLLFGAGTLLMTEAIMLGIGFLILGLGVMLHGASLLPDRLRAGGLALILAGVGALYIGVAYLTAVPYGIGFVLLGLGGLLHGARLHSDRFGAGRARVPADRCRGPASWEQFPSRWKWAQCHRVPATRGRGAGARSDVPARPDEGGRARVPLGGSRRTAHRDPSVAIRTALGEAAMGRVHAARGRRAAGRDLFPAWPTKAVRGRLPRVWDRGPRPGHHVCAQPSELGRNHDGCRRPSRGCALALWCRESPGRARHAIPS